MVVVAVSTLYTLKGTINYVPLTPREHGLLPAHLIHASGENISLSEPRANKSQTGIVENAPSLVFVRAVSREIRSGRGQQYRRAVFVSLCSAHCHSARLRDTVVFQNRRPFALDTQRNVSRCYTSAQAVHVYIYNTCKHLRGGPRKEIGGAKPEKI